MRHFYHLFCGAQWQAIAESHLDALQSTGCDWEITAGIIGPSADRQEAREIFATRFPQAVFVEASEGWEQVTLRRLHDWAKRTHASDPVLYAHSKGVTHKPGDGRHPLFAPAWRVSMTSQVVGGWDRCVELLREHDAVGCHWLTPDAYAEEGVQSPFFGGNFWWANAGYLAGLSPVSNDARHDAEAWLGLGDPHVFDLKPGWPTFGLFAQEAVALLNPGVAASVSAGQ